MEDYKDIVQGNIVEYDGELYYVLDAQTFGLKPGKDRVVLAPLNDSNCSSMITHSFPDDTVTEDPDTGEECLVKKAVRLEGIKYIADNVEEFVMDKVRSVVFSRNEV